MLGNYKSGLKLGLILCQGGEFGIVIISGAYSLNILHNDLNIILVSLFTSSLLLAPILAKLSEYVKVSHNELDKSIIKETNN
jgi:CPA2 family monovalent cation:H+ antiporter-2